jgi:hypothetical protein
VVAQLCLPCADLVSVAGIAERSIRALRAKQGQIRLVVEEEVGHRRRRRRVAGAVDEKTNRKYCDKKGNVVYRLNIYIGLSNSIMHAPWCTPQGAASNPIDCLLPPALEAQIEIPCIQTTQLIHQRRHILTRNVPRLAGHPIIDRK